MPHVRAKEKYKYVCNSEVYVVAVARRFKLAGQIPIGKKNIEKIFKQFLLFQGIEIFGPIGQFRGEGDVVNGVRFSLSKISTRMMKILWNEILKSYETRYIADMPSTY